jgi:release factor glutamine methyltransferase
MKVYEPAEDSFLLEDCILKENLSGFRCLDMGTGSGILSSAMIKAGAKEVIAVDVNYKALLACGKLNFKNKNKMRFIESDLFDKLKGEVFDFITFNPPYLPSEDIKWKDLDGGKKGREITDKFLTQFVGHLSPNGICLLLISSLNNEEEVVSEIEKKGLFVEVLSRKKLFFEELIILRITKKETIGIDNVNF